MADILHNADFVRIDNTIKLLLNLNYNPTFYNVINEGRSITHPKLGITVVDSYAGQQLEPIEAKFDTRTGISDYLKVGDLKQNVQYARQVTSRENIGVSVDSGKIMHRTYYADSYGINLDFSNEQVAYVSNISKQLQSVLGGTTTGGTISKDVVSSELELLNQLSVETSIGAGIAALQQTLDITVHGGSFNARNIGEVGNTAYDYTSPENLTGVHPSLFLFEDYLGNPSLGNNPASYTKCSSTVHYKNKSGTPSVIFDASGNFIPVDNLEVISFFMDIYNSYYKDTPDFRKKRLKLVLSPRFISQMQNAETKDQVGQTTSTSSRYGVIMSVLEPMYEVVSYSEIETYMKSVGSSDSFGLVYDPSPDNIIIVQSRPVANKGTLPYQGIGLRWGIRAASAGVIPLQTLDHNGHGIIKITGLSETPITA